MLKNLIVVKHLTDNILLVCDANQSDSVRSVLWESQY